MLTIKTDRPKFNNSASLRLLLALTVVVVHTLELMRYVSDVRVGPVSPSRIVVEMFFLPLRHTYVLELWEQLGSRIFH
jgi:hypothetical protein